MSDINVKENSEHDVPLTRQKGKKPLNLVESINEPVPEIITVSNPKKEKKPRSEKQIAQFLEVANRRKESLEKKNLEKKIEASKLLLKHDPEYIKKQTPIEQSVEQPNEQRIVENKPKKKEPKIIEVDNSSSDSEESVIIIKKKKNKKQKKKKIIIEESESESSSSEEEDVVQMQKPKRNFITQQNKKSIVKIHEKPKVCYDNYFC